MKIERTVSKGFRADISDIDYVDMERTRWWRVVGPDGELWSETSVEQEARQDMRPGDTLEKLYSATLYEWREVDQWNTEQTELTAPYGSFPGEDDGPVISEDNLPENIGDGSGGLY